MVKKKRSMGRVRKKSNTTISTVAEQGGDAKRSKTESVVSNVKNKLVCAIKAMVESMNEKDLYSVMAHVATVGGKEEEAKSRAIESTEGLVVVASATTTTTTEVHGATAAAATTTTTTGGTAAAAAVEPATPTIVHQPTPPPIQLNNSMRPP